MSNRLSFAHVAPRHDVHEFFAAPAQARGLAAGALHWLRGFAVNDAATLSPAMRLDVGLPERATAPFAYDVERSRVRV